MINLCNVYKNYISKLKQDKKKKKQTSNRLLPLSFQLVVIINKIEEGIKRYHNTDIFLYLEKYLYL